MNPYVELAQRTIKNYLDDGKVLDQKYAPEILQKEHAGCFVTLHLKENRALRGCIGTILPTHKNLASEIVNNAISACNDPRFPKLTKEEFTNLDISVDILSEPEPIASINLLDPKKYGVIVKSQDGRTGLLLPDIEGIDDAAYQVAIARQKAGISANEKVFLYRFTSQRHE